MSKIFLILFLILTSINFAQLIGPKAVFEEKSYDFGDIDEGVKVSHDFVIFNNGGDILKIDRVKASCGCTAAKPDVDELAPGESTKITVSFNSDRRVGNQKKYVYVFTNDAEEPEVRLSFTANVINEGSEKINSEIPKLQIRDRRHDFGKVTESDVLNWEVNIRNTGSKELVINEIKSSCNCIKAEATSKKLKQGEVGSLKIEFNTSNLEGKLTRTVTLYSNDVTHPRQSITLYVNIEKRQL